MHKGRIQTVKTVIGDVWEERKGGKRKDEDEPGIELSKREEVRAEVEGRHGIAGRERSARNMILVLSGRVGEFKRDEEEEGRVSLHHYPP